MKTYRKLPSLYTLAKVALCGSLMIGSLIQMIEYKFQKRIRETSTYKRALDIFRSNEKVVKYLGEPIKEGKVKITSDKDDIKKFTVSMKGSNTKGKLNCEFKIVADCKTEIQKVELAFLDVPNKLHVLHKI